MRIVVPQPVVDGVMVFKWNEMFCAKSGLMDLRGYLVSHMREPGVVFNCWIGRVAGDDYLLDAKTFGTTKY